MEDARKKPTAALVLAIISIVCAIILFINFSSAIGALPYFSEYVGTSNFGTYISSLFILITAVLSIVASALCIGTYINGSRGMATISLVIAVIALVSSIVGIAAYNLWLLMAPLILAPSILALIAAFQAKKHASV